MIFKKSNARPDPVASMCNVHECALPIVVVLSIATDVKHVHTYTCTKPFRRTHIPS